MNWRIGDEAAKRIELVDAWRRLEHAKHRALTNALEPDAFPQGSRTSDFGLVMRDLQANWVTQGAPQACPNAGVSSTTLSAPSCVHAAPSPGGREHLAYTLKWSHRSTYDGSDAPRVLASSSGASVNRSASSSRESCS